MRPSLRNLFVGTDVAANAYRMAGLLLAAFVVFGAACGSDRNSPDATATGVPPAAAPTSSLSGHLTIFAASSLTDAFSKEKAAFIAANPNVSIEFNFAGSSALVTQLQQAAPADILATAAQKNMDTALQNGSVVDAGKVFVTNRLAIIVPKANPANITTPFDLKKSGIKLVIAEEGVPVGDYARQIFTNLEAGPQGGTGFADKVLGNVVSNEANVKAVVSKVQLGEADAAIAYVTDVAPDVASDITIVPIADTYNVIASYPIAVTTNAGNAGAASAFIDYLLSSPGQLILQSYGFLPPR
jgi:molybdate transport system substrate-binding protein